MLMMRSMFSFFIFTITS